MEKLTICLDRSFPGGEIRDEQNAAIYHGESARNPFVSLRGTGGSDGTQEEGFRGLAKRLGGHVKGALLDRVVFRDVLTDSGFALETADVLSRSDVDDGDLKQVYNVKKVGPGVAYLHIDQGGWWQSPGAVPEKITDLEGKLLGWGRRPAEQRLKRRYLLQSPDGEIFMETKREGWREVAFSIHRSSGGEQIGWLRKAWCWNDFLVTHAFLLLFLMMGVVFALIALVSPLFFVLLLPLFLVLFLWRFTQPLLIRRFARWNEYQLEFWGKEQERLHALFLSLTIAKMRSDQAYGD